MKKIGLEMSVRCCGESGLGCLHFGKCERAAEVKHSLACLQAFSSNHNYGVIFLADRHAFLQLRFESGNDRCKELYSELTRASDGALIMDNRYVDEGMPVLPWPFRFYGFVIVVIVGVVQQKLRYWLEEMCICFHGNVHKSDVCILR